MTGQSNYPRPVRLDDQTRNRRLSIVVFALIAAALLAILGVYASIPVTERRANAPPVNETAQAIRDLQASQQRAADQLKALQQTVSSDQAEIIRLSEKVTALTGKLEALQQSFARAQRAPALLQPLEPAKQKRVAR
jgi:septal ring factor EnvC (AmiA/AmiB activator)